MIEFFFWPYLRDVDFYHMRMCMVIKDANVSSGLKCIKKMSIGPCISGEFLNQIEKKFLPEIRRAIQSSEQVALIMVQYSERQRLVAQRHVNVAQKHKRILRLCDTTHALILEGIVRRLANPTHISA